MSIHSEAVKTLNHAVAILDEYGATYDVKEVGFYGVTIKAVCYGGGDYKTVTLKLPRDANKREVRKLIDVYVDDITPADYLS